MKIVRLEAENVKRLRAVSIQPSGALVEITGKNGNGKTSVLDAIWWALQGGKNIQAKPIRNGAEEAIIKLDLGELKVTRKFRGKEDGSFTTSLVVENAEGMRPTSPQALLDALVGELTFDPLAFTRMKAKDQFDALKGLVPGVDFDGIVAANKQDYDERTIWNRRAKDYGAQASGILLPSPVPARVDESALVAELENAGSHNADIERRKARRAEVMRAVADARKSAEDCDREIARLLAEIEVAKQSKDEFLLRAETEQKRLDTAPPLPEPIDTAQVRAKIDAARQTNAVAERATQKAALQQQARDAEEKANALTKAIDAREKAKREAVAAAEMPVDGLAFGDGEVLLNGVPFEQGSDAEKLRASIAIAAAMNPRLRVIRVRDGALLDDDSMRILAEFAAEKDLQVWIETVASGRPGSIVIEDGEVASSFVAAAE